jgi:hypothetical protein
MIKGGSRLVWKNSWFKALASTSGGYTWPQAKPLFLIIPESRGSDSQHSAERVSDISSIDSHKRIILYVL